MRRLVRDLILFVIGGVFGAVFGFGVGILTFPFIFPPPPAKEVLAEADKARLVATGTFIHANPSDPIHYGKGRVSVYERTVFLEPDFEVGPGPDYYVYLVPKVPIRANADMKGVMFVDLGRLRAFKGSQAYAIPAGVDLAKYPSVVIWCRTFGALISPADLKVASAK